MHIGLIGGIGPAATDYYYQRIIRAFLKAETELDLTTVHASSATLLPNLAANNIEGQLAIYDRLTKRLAAAGADCVVVTSIAGHFCINEFKEISPLTVIDMIEETRQRFGVVRHHPGGRDVSGVLVMLDHAVVRRPCGRSGLAGDGIGGLLEGSPVVGHEPETRPEHQLLHHVVTLQQLG